jgi:hypothetical protein
MGKRENMALGKAMAARVKKTAGMSTNRESDKIIVRLPEGMRAHLAWLAQSHGRSMSAEVAFALAIHFAQFSVPHEGDASPDELLRCVTELNAEVRRLVRKIETVLPKDETSAKRNKHK